MDLQVALMTTTSTPEANVALLTAGLVMLAVGALLGSFPNGSMLGVVIACAGAVLFVVFAFRIWRDRRSRPIRDASEPKDPDRIWNAEDRLASLMAVSGVATVGTVVLAFAHQTPERLSLLWISGPVLVASGASFLLVRRRNRRTYIPRDLGDNQESRLGSTG